MKTDVEIQNDVIEELRWEPLLNASEIGVAVKDGIVTLSGVVSTFGKKIAAENAAKRVYGVKAVAEDIEVKLVEGGRKNDTEIAGAVMNALKWHSAVQENKIQVKVENGWVTLEGEVEWEFQKAAARSMVQDLSGVVGILNKIRIVPSVKAEDIKRKISAAFHRSATLDAEKIHLDISGSKVTLTGKVRSFVEKRDAERAAWLAPGVDKVDNRLEIDTEVFAF